MSDADQNRDSADVPTDHSDEEPQALPASSSEDDEAEAADHAPDHAERATDPTGDVASGGGEHPA